ncbi:Uncharacterised protein [Enterobacter cloacae]|nr:Uncharacterised protein [Enterobacter cloacae]
MYLVKGFPNRHTTLLQFNLYQWQPIDQYRDVIAIGMRSRLFKLLDNLQLIANKVFLVDKTDIFKTTIIKSEITNVVIMNLTGFIDKSITGVIEITLSKAPPFTFRKGDIIQVL